jgi:hypothetical protein
MIVSRIYQRLVKSIDYKNDERAAFGINRIMVSFGDFSEFASSMWIEFHILRILQGLTESFVDWYLCSAGYGRRDGPEVCVTTPCDNGRVLISSLAAV